MCSLVIEISRLYVTGVLRKHFKYSICLCGDTQTAFPLQIYVKPLIEIKMFQLLFPQNKKRD